MDVPLPWERLLWRGRSLSIWPARYALTDFRLVTIGHRHVEELLLQDIADIQRSQHLLDKLIGTSTLVVCPKDRRQPPIVLRRIRRGAQLAALLELVAGEPHASIDADEARAALSWEPKTERGGLREAFAVLAATFAAVFAVGLGLHGKAATATYPADDAIFPNGEKRDRAAITEFMRDVVMPWAREALGPLKGGPDRITCETCHGPTPAARDWQMPAVAALPQPDVTLRGWETYSAAMDPQTRNAIYGYVAESDNQTKAAYMRELVLPGMARLLHRPAYDFTKPYEYNRTRLAFGCYHCHQVR